MKKTAEEAYRGILQNNFCEYVSFTHHGDWKKTPFHRLLCSKVQEFVERESDKPYEILCIHTPPQVGKSTTITETLPSWYMGKHPKNKVIEISYGEDFAILFGRRNREKIEEYGEKIFGITLSKDKNTTREFEIAGYKGSMISRGRQTGVTGRSCNLMIIDDPIKNSQEASSEAYRSTLWSEWLYSYRSRMAPGGKVIVIMTRWHEDDLVGRLLEYETNVEYLRFPCEAEGDDILGRKAGDALCPEIGKGNKWLEEFKPAFLSSEGSMAWNALYQGRPTAQEGNLLKRDWWQYYDTLPEIVDWVMSVDATFKDSNDNDFVAIQVWGKAGANIYLVENVKKHLNFPDTVMEIRRLRGLYDQCKLTLIEDKANGSAIITMLRTELVGIIPVEPQGSKVARVNAILGAVESGNVYLPKNKKWVPDFVNECAQFPNGKHDDQVDAMSQALNRIIYQRSQYKRDEKLSNFEKMFPGYFKHRKGKEKYHVI